MFEHWIDNLVSIEETGVAGDCPFCKSKNTDFTFRRISGEMGYGVIWCNDCKKGFHISRAKISDKYPLNKPIPKGLTL